MKMTEQQEHLKQALDQQKQLVAESTSLSDQLNIKREMIFKLQGIIEYLQQIGVTLPEPELVDQEQEDSEELS